MQISDIDVGDVLVRPPVFVEGDGGRPPYYTVIIYRIEKNSVHGYSPELESYQCITSIGVDRFVQKYRSTHSTKELKPTTNPFK